MRQTALICLVIGCLILVAVTTGESQKITNKHDWPINGMETADDKTNHMDNDGTKGMRNVRDGADNGDRLKGLTAFLKSITNIVKSIDVKQLVQLLKPILEQLNANGYLKSLGKIFKGHAENYQTPKT